ncbi:fam11a b protein [Anaeramoeba flamelloides]|uniref:Fam11a b protein n=1 Tax=Anaeramoeba flamelloides TaxID=1746091 RepID=A0AAV7ZVQ0_9EUKA|nr:fam11a b protein [Anaeramoeba flamelloides]
MMELNDRIKKNVTEETRNHTYVSHNYKTVIKIKDYKEGPYICGRWGAIANKAKDPPSGTEDLTLDQLPEAVLWEIFRYLPPIKLIFLETMCISFNNIIQDQALWKEVSYRYEDLFIWDNIDFDRRASTHKSHLQTFGNLSDLANVLYKKIDNRDDVSGSSSGSDTQDDELNKHNKNNHSNNNSGNQSNLKRELKEFIYQDRRVGGIVIQTTKKIRMQYIHELENPKEVLISKIKELKNIDEKKTRIVESNLKRNRQLRLSRNFNGNFIFNSSKLILLLLSLGLVASTVLLNLFVDNKLDDKNKLWIIFPFILIIAIMIILFFIFFIAKKRDTDIFKCTEVLIIIPILLGCGYLLLLPLRALNYFSFRYTYCAIPLLIVIGIIACAAIMYGFKVDSENYRQWFSMLPLLIIPSCIFIFILLGCLKLDNKIEASWPKIFIPLFYIHFSPFVVVCFLLMAPCDACDAKYTDSLAALGYLYLMILGLMLLPLCAFEILLVVYASTSGISHFGYVLIPIYLYELIAFSLSILNCSSPKRDYY